MNREEAEFILAPIILGFEVAKDRANELLKQSQERGLDRFRLHEVVRHESDLEQALAYLLARARAWSVDGLMQAVETGSRSAACWPGVMPGSDYRERTITAWRESKAAGTESAPNVVTMARPA
jgi:hypothetical protein